MFYNPYFAFSTSVTVSLNLNKCFTIPTLRYSFLESEQMFYNPYFALRRKIEKVGEITSCIRCPVLYILYTLHNTIIIIMYDIPYHV